MEELKNLRNIFHGRLEETYFIEELKRHIS
jgi:hypothetical protein